MSSDREGRLTERKKKGEETQKNRGQRLLTGGKEKKKKGGRGKYISGEEKLGPRLLALRPRSF